MGTGATAADEAGSTGADESSTGDSTGETDATKFDLPADTGPIDECSVAGGMDAPGPCDQKAPPGSFAPELQWSFAGEGAEVAALAVPVVVNLTDDNDDGAIDLCDVPDVVAPLYAPGNLFASGHIYVLDGATGELHYRIADDIAPRSHPAVGDIDGDGQSEIVATQFESGFSGYLVAYEHDGTPKWTGDTVVAVAFHAIALADLDNDGDVEIMVGGHVADHEGQGIFTSDAVETTIQTTTAADLDGDGDLEVIQGPFAWHHDGSPYYAVDLLSRGHPQVANLDGDDDPEVLIVDDGGVTILEHDGTVKMIGEEPVSGAGSWWRPAAVHDMDGDGAAEIAVGSSDRYSVVEADLQLVWSTDVQDNSGFAAGTAFDFLGAGTAQAMYADEWNLYVYDSEGAALFSAERSSVTQIEFPVVVDVDNDRSAEVLVVSNEGYAGQTQPAIQVLRDQEDRWVPARRIWNQHTYHVTNVEEDGTIPQHEPPHWQLLNTFRTQAQAEAGSVCQPEG